MSADKKERSNLLGAMLEKSRADEPTDDEPEEPVFNLGENEEEVGNEPAEADEIITEDVGPSEDADEAVEVDSADEAEDEAETARVISATNRKFQRMLNQRDRRARKYLGRRTRY